LNALDSPENYSKPRDEFVRDLVERQVRPPIPDDCPPPWSDLIKKCWNQSPQLRPSFEDINRTLVDMEGLLYPTATMFKKRVKNFVLESKQ